MSYSDEMEALELERIVPREQPPLTTEQLTSICVSAVFATVKQLHPQASTGNVPMHYVEMLEDSTRRAILAWRAYNDPNSCTQCGEQLKPHNCKRAIR